MNLEYDFCAEIKKQEQKWIEQINSKLMNAYYCYHKLRPFYLEQQKRLMGKDNDALQKIESILLKIENIYLKQNSIDSSYLNPSIIVNTYLINNSDERSNDKVTQKDFEDLANLFLVNQLKKEKVLTDDQKIKNIEYMNKEELQEEKQRLINQAYSQPTVYTDDYLYEDFPEEGKVL